jgi:hypothetical protein
LDRYHACVASTGGTSFSAKFDKYSKVWKTFVVNLNKVEDPDGKLVFGVQCIREKAIKKYFEELMVFVEGNMDHILFESRSNDADECNRP